MIKLITLAAAAAAGLAACASDHPITDPAGSLSQSFSTSAPASARNSGFYDHQIIEYEATAEVTSSPQAAQLISKGNIVFHIVGANGTTPAVQCARLLAALPNDATSCNVLNFIPTEVGYAGGAWNLQIFHWKSGLTPVELSKDDDILAAVAAGLGTLEVTPILVRCPVVNFANLR
jgi:hypothetical protein